VHITVPQRGDKRELIDLAGTNAKQSYDQRFRVMKPNAKAIQEALQDALGLPEPPKRIECFDISAYSRSGNGRLDGGVGRRQDEEVGLPQVHHQDGRGRGRFRQHARSGHAPLPAPARQTKTEEKKPMPSLVLIDGGLGQLHAAAQALEALEIINQPLAAIAKREEIIYVYGQEDDPIVLDHHSPVLHLVQMIRDEAHRFAVTFHRKRRQIRDRATELREIPGVGESTTRRLLEHFGSLQTSRGGSKLRREVFPQRRSSDGQLTGSGAST
jgi:excinuclease ABC subunit C